jgi:rare lipoprotein A
VVVRINDRGPFVKGRIIDVSKAAASSLGMLGSGTARVRVSAVGKRSSGKNVASND